MKHGNFKTCDQSGFCKRNRAYADTASHLAHNWESPYKLDSSSITFHNGQLSAVVLKKIATSGEEVRLPLTVTFLESGAQKRLLLRYAPLTRIEG